MEITRLKDTIQDSHINFLIGYGFSTPYLSILGNVESLLFELDKDSDLTKEEKDIVEASILGNFFESVIQKNLFIINETIDSLKDEVLNNYRNFLTNLNLLLLKRKGSILSKQINIFTTNVDVFFEKAFEETQIEFTDGFMGRIKPIFSLTNYKKSLFKKSMQYDNSAEIPVFNLLKVHGSLTWKSEKEKIIYSELTDIDTVNKKWTKIKGNAINFDIKADFTYFKNEVRKIVYNKSYSDFLDEYKRFAIVIPKKTKFSDTLINLNYYELLRIFSNELEKENSLLLIMGFSIADEHIREIILRAANSNPTLLILVYCYNNDAKKQIDENIKKGNVKLRYNNIKFIFSDSICYDFKNINEKVFELLLKEIEKL